MARFQDTLRISEERLRRYYFGGQRVLMAFALCTVLGAVFLVAGSIFLRLEKRDTERYTLAIGHVTDKYRRTESQKTPEGETHLNYVYWLRYRYQDDIGLAHEVRNIVEFADWDRVQKGEAVTVEYQTANPEQSKLLPSYSKAGRRVAVFCLAAGMLICGGTGLVAAGKCVGAYARTRRIRNGVPIPGEVIERVPRKFPQFGDKVQYRLRYRFTDPQGNERTGNTIWLPRDIACCFASGDFILVLCSPTLPQSHEADVFQARLVDTTVFAR
jgi:Protein of unknown function (DUF3592)